MLRIAFVCQRTILDTVCGTSNSRLDSTIDVEYYRPVGDRLVSKTRQGTLRACLEKRIHIILGTADFNALRLEMRLKASPDEIVCSQAPHKERHLKSQINFMIQSQGV